MTPICILCDGGKDQGCASAYVPTYKLASHDSDTIIAAARKEGWQIARDKRKADDLCPACIAALNRRVRG